MAGFWQNMGVVDRGERSGCVGGREVGALFRVHGMRKRKPRFVKDVKETVVRKSRGAHGSATGEVGSGWS
jgi:hypothetical protein